TFRNLALSNQTILLASLAGSVYLFQNDGYSWVQRRKFKPLYSMNDDQFGTAIALQGDLALIGAPGALGPPETGNSGAAYFVDLDPQTDCNVNGVADACDISDGTSADVNANGIPDECELPQCAPVHRVLAAQGGDAYF